MNNIVIIKDLIKELNSATIEWEKNNPILSDVEWDNKYYKLKELEEKTNIVYPNSPTQSISFNKETKLNKIKHNHDMLSLDKTKELEELINFSSEKDLVFMSKMDGLTCSLLYDKGELISAETRGDGYIGEEITHNAKVISSIPKKINYNEKLVIDGEIICTDTNFLKHKDEGYKNSRNYAAGSIRLLDSKECSKRDLDFVAWDIIISSSKNIDNNYFNNSMYSKLNFLNELGFLIPANRLLKYNKEKFEEYLQGIKEESRILGYPIDGVVCRFDDLNYGDKLGQTTHHFNNALAYKFYDETYITSVQEIEWTMGRTGILTPVAVFDPIEIQGTTVERASLHNLSVLKDLNLKYQGQQVEVFKANFIIPQILKVYPYENSEGETKELKIPSICPICGGKTEVIKTETSTILKCTNSNCEGKLINKLDHFCGKKGMDIKGLSKATLDKLIEWGWINKNLDIYNLKNYKMEWINKKGFGEKSVSNILQAIEDSKQIELNKFICAIGIPLIGSTASKQLSKEFNNDWESFVSYAKDEKYDFSELKDFGPEMNNAIKKFDFSEAIEIFSQYLSTKETEQEIIVSKKLEDKNIVITGKLKEYKNREEFKGVIESLGGKVVSSVNKKTFLLINNDIESTSSKNLKAKELNVPIITEENFIKNYL